MSADRSLSSFENLEDIVTTEEPTEYSYDYDVNKAMMPEAGVTMTQFIQKTPHAKKTKSTLNGPIIDRGKPSSPDRRPTRAATARTVATGRERRAERINMYSAKTLSAHWMLAVQRH